MRELSRSIVTGSWAETMGQSSLREVRSPTLIRARNKLKMKLRQFSRIQNQCENAHTVLGVQIDHKILGGNRGHI